MTKVTKRRTKKDFAMFVKEVLDRYLKDRKLHIILDNFNTHFASSFEETFGEEEATRILQRIKFHYTPKHASWLNVAEIEITLWTWNVQTEDSKISKAWNRKSVHELEGVIVKERKLNGDLIENRRAKNY